MEERIGAIVAGLPAGFLDPSDRAGFLGDLFLLWGGLVVVLLTINFIGVQLHRLVSSGGLATPHRGASRPRGSLTSGFTAAPSIDRIGQPDALEDIMRAPRRQAPAGGSFAAENARYGRPQTPKPLRHEQIYRASGLKSKTAPMTVDARKKRKKSN